MSAAFLRFAENARKFLEFPAFYFRFVALQSATLWLLTGPAHSRMQETTDVIGMVGNAKVALNQCGDSTAGPEFVGPAMGFGTLKQQLFKFGQLLVVQSRWRILMRLGCQSTGFLLLAEPTVESNAVHAQITCDYSR